MTAHEFDLNGTQCPFVYCAQAVVALERNKMLVGDPTARMVYFGVMAHPPSEVDLTQVGGVLAADIEGPTPIPDIEGQPAPGLFFGGMADEWGAPFDAINVYKFIVDWANPAASDFVLDKTIPVASFNPLNPGGNDIPQPGVSTSSYLDSLSDRAMHRVVIRNMGSHSLIGGNHTVCAPGLADAQCTTAGQYQAAIRWYILNYDNNTGDVTLADQGTYTGNPPDTHSRWMASVTFDKDANFCVSYTVSSRTVYPSIRYACRAPGDPPGTLGPEAELQAGSASQTDTSGLWGEYSMISIDPTDECTFWPIHEYYTTTNPPGCSETACWHTRFGFFKFPSCGCPTPSTPTLVSPPNGATGVSTTPTLDWSDVTGATSYDVQVCRDSGCTDVAQSQTGLTASQWTVSPALNNGTTYYWRARAVNSCGAGPWSETWSFTTHVMLTVVKNVARGGTVTSDPAGINCGTNCASQSASFSAGTVVTLTATAAEGWEFSGWNGCDSVSGNQCTVTMNANRTVRANFTRVPSS